MIGLTYTQSYWHRKGVSPELFSKLGQVVPKSFYQRQIFSLSVNQETSSHHMVQFDKKHLDHLAHNNQPLNAERGNYISCYEVRRLLSSHGDLPPCYGEQAADSLAKILEEKFTGKNIKIGLFWQNPQLVETRSMKPNTYDTEIVCKADTESEWRLLTTFFSTRHLLVTHCEQTNEVILKECNDSDKRDDYRLKLLS